MGRVEQQIVLFESHNERSGIFSAERHHNLDQINGLLGEGWRVVAMSPTSSPSTNVGVIATIFALVVLEREVPEGG